MPRYDVEITIDRGPSVSKNRFIKGKANPWPLTFEAAFELAEQERAKKDGRCAGRGGGGRG